MAMLLAGELLKSGHGSHTRVRAGKDAGGCAAVSATPCEAGDAPLPDKVIHYLLCKLEALGLEQCAGGSSRHLFDELPFRPDIVLSHTMRADLMRIEDLYRLCRHAPLIWTLHDMWAFTGHCAYSFDCLRWQRGCGNCPYPDVYVPLRYDLSRLNLWRRRHQYRRISRLLPDRLHLVCPSQWLTGCVQKSIAGDLPVHHIPYGIDTAVFTPFTDHQRRNARSRLGISHSAFTVLFSANLGKRNPFKDYATFAAAARLLKQAVPSCCVLAAGDPEADREDTGIVSLGRVPSPEDMAAVYNCADVFVHATKADNFPVSVLEAMACGVPVVGTAVGGVSEQIEHGRTGFLTGPGDAGAIVRALRRLYGHQDERRRAGAAGAEKVRASYRLERMVDDYLRLCETVLT